MTSAGDEPPGLRVSISPWAVLSGIVLSLFARLLWTPLADPDLFWHLRTGRWMWEHRRFPTTETFTHTLAGAPWIDFEALPQLFFHAFERLSGLEGVRISALALSLLAVLILLLTARSAGARGPWSVLWLLFAFWFLKPRLYARPEIFSWIFMAFFAWAAVSARRRPVVWRARLPWVLGAAMLLWVNAHAGFIHGILFLAALAAGARWAGDPPEFVRSLDRALVVCLAVIPLTPAGARVVEVVLETAFAVRQGAPIDEWRRLAATDAPLYWASLAASAAFLARGILRGEPLEKFWAPAVVGFFIVGATAIRAAVLPVFVVVPWLGARVASWDRSSGLRRAAVAAALLSAALTAWKALSAPHPAGILSRRLPTAACAFVREAGIDGTMYNAYGFGGYIEWSLPDRKAFQDGRYLFMPFIREETALAAFLPDSDRRGLWAAYLDRYHVDYAIADDRPVEWVRLPGRMNPQPFLMNERLFPEKDWALVYWDDAAWVYVKRLPKFRDIIRDREYRTLRPEKQEILADLLRAGGLSREDASAELSRHEREVPFSLRRSLVRGAAGL